MTLLGAGKPPSGSAYDPDAQAIFDEMTTPPDDTRKGVINTLVLALKSAGVWTLCDAIYVLAAADSQAARINWKNPTETELTENNSPTFTTDRGYTGNASNMYLAGPTNTNVMANFSLNSAHIAWFSTTTGNRTGDAGGGTGLFVTGNNSGNTLRGRINQTTATNYGASIGAGFYRVDRPNSTTENGYNNEVFLAAATISSSAVDAHPFNILRGGAGAVYSNAQICFASIGASLGGANTAFKDAVRAYLTSVGVP